MVEAAQTGPMQRASSFCDAHHGDKNEVRIPQGTARSNNKAADRTTRGFIAMLLGWYPNAYSFAGVTLFLTLVPTAICCPGPANGTFALPPRRNDGSSRVRGRALLSFRLVPGIRQRSLLSLQIETCAPFNSCLARCPCLSTFLLAYLSVTVDREL